MSFEDIGITPEMVEGAAEDVKLSAFQNPSFMEMTGHDLMPKIRFTTDKAEEEAAKADRSNPFDLPDAVFYVEPKSDTNDGERKAGISRDGAFQNESFDIDVSTFTHDATEGASGEYVGPSPDMINLQMESDVRALTFAQEQLAEAIARGTGVMQAMRNVESAQAVLDARMKLYNEAIAFRAPEAPVAAASDSRNAGEAGAAGEKSDNEMKLGSVSHAQWELEQAYNSGNKIAIENAKRDLAHEKAKEEAKK